MKQVLPVYLFTILVLLLPHGTLENIAFVGLIGTGAIGLWRLFKS